MDRKEYDLLGAATKESTPPRQLTGRLLGKVISVYDGDTCRVAVVTPGRPPRAEYVTVRMLGYDSPEMRKTGGLDHAPYGKEVRDALRALVLGKIVVLEIPPLAKSDPYGRVLGRLFAALAPEGAPTNVMIRGRIVEIPETANVDRKATEAPLAVNQWMVSNARVKIYGGEGARPEWTAAELAHGV